MKIKHLIIGENPLGLEHVNLTKHNLGSVVALIGPNGAGKSRVLEYIKNEIVNVSSDSAWQYDFKPFANNNIGVGSRAFPAFVRKHIKEFDVNKTQRENIVYSDILSNKENVINALNLSFNEINSLNINTVFDYIKSITQNSTGIKVAELINSNGEKKAKNVYEKEFEDFNVIMKRFLNKSFHYTVTSEGRSFDTVLSFGNNNFDFDKLSPGEKILFRYACAMFLYQKSNMVNIQDCIIIIDEPENHLHPKYQIELIDSLANLVENTGQLWIATHSIHILSHLGFEKILMVHDNKVSPPSRSSHSKILRQLVEKNDHIESLAKLTYSISDYHYAMFVKECFERPNIISKATEYDPQFLLLKEKISNDISVKVLDFGAGMGRIGQVIGEMENIKNRNLIDYHAYDISEENVEYIKKCGITSNVYSDIENIPNSTFDFVILCNVLHEINPSMWLEIFSSIKKMLNDKGCLLILEDLELIRGEVAHEYGYLILGPKEIRCLFNLDEIEEIKPEGNNRDRLFLLSIPKSNVTANKESLIKSIKILKDNIYNNLKNMKNDRIKDELQARKYAHFSQLYINAEMFLKDNA